MKRKILFINPVGHDIWNKEVEEYLSSYKDEETQLEVTSLGAGLPEHLEYNYYEVLIAEKLLHRIKKAENEGYDACIIGCYYDPFLQAAREICEKMVVTAPAEAAMHIGSTLGSSFSVLVVRNKTMPEMKVNVYHHGFGNYLASFRSLEIGVQKLQEDPEYTKERMRQEIKKAVEEDQAEVVLLGCTIQMGFFRQLQEEFQVPVIDANIAPLKYAEFLCELKEKAGWYFSKRGIYEGPQQEEIKKWGIEEYFQVSGMWGK
ncbi:MAG: hydantoin racemase [Ruminococcus sp.]|nr:hydantoin racemase [Ruminococcus sp.]